MKQTVRTAFNRRLSNQLPDLPSAPQSVRADMQSISSQSLFGGCNEIDILHCGERYSLRITRFDKLILTK